MANGIAGEVHENLDDAPRLAARGKAADPFQREKYPTLLCGGLDQPHRFIRELGEIDLAAAL